MGELNSDSSTFPGRCCTVFQRSVFGVDKSLAQFSRWSIISPSVFGQSREFGGLPYETVCNSGGASVII
jgi:hypothetical protein